MSTLREALRVRALLPLSRCSEVARLKAACLIVGLALLALCIFNLAEAPPLWWDEGWTLSVARNWVEFGHYGRLLNGQPHNSLLSAALPVTAPVALSFKLFGVGGWQSRLPGVLFLAGSLGLMFFLARRLYNLRVALGTLVFLAFLFPHADIHPAYLSRQVLGEPAMLFYLLAGYALCLLALKDRPWLLPVVVLFWGLALKSKLQVLPFWAVSVGLAVAFSLFQRQWRQAAWLSVAAGLAYVLAEAIGFLQPALLPGYLRATGGLDGLNEVTAFVLDAEVRRAALRTTVLFAGPVLVSLAGCAWWSWREVADLVARPQRPEQTVRWMLLALVGSWAVWFSVLSVGWIRYLYPVLFVGALFLAALWERCLAGLEWSAVVGQVRAAFKAGAAWRLRLSVFALTLLLGWSGLLGARALGTVFSRPGDASVYAAAHFLNTQTPPDARLETYDSQLFFLLDRRYHYPLDQLHITAIRREFLDTATSLEYDAFVADPDYLVVGPFSRWTRVYAAALTSGQFRLVYQYGLYEVFQRER